jgi:hypothetical protein
MILASRSGDRAGQERSKAASATVKTVELTPIPNARVKTATAVKPGLLANMRAAKRRSCQKVSSQGKPRLSR